MPAPDFDREVAVPTQSEGIVDGKVPSPRYYDWFKSIELRLRLAVENFPGEEIVDQTEFGTWQIETPRNKSYYPILYPPFDCTIKKTHLICIAGSASAQFKNSGANLGSAQAVGTGAVTSVVHSTGNIITAGVGGHYLEMLLSSVAGCSDLLLSIEFTRPLSRLV